MRNYRNLIFYIPFLYSFHTRFQGLRGFCEFILKYLIPTLGTAFLFNGYQVSTLNYILGLFLVYTLYEVGYIQNDAETIKKETNPTMRLQEDQLSFYNAHRLAIYSIRFILAVLLTIAAYKAGISSLALAFTWLIMPTYLVYNQVRGVVTFPLYCWLMQLRFFGLIWMVCTNANLGLFLFVLALHPLPTTIIRMSKGAVGVSFNFVNCYLLPAYEKMNTFRLEYYASLLAIVLGLYYLEYSIGILLPICIFMAVIALLTFTRDNLKKITKKND